MQLTLIQQIAVWAVPILLAVTLHEAAHAWTAYRLGDVTAKLLGRVSLNPFVHIDPVGTVLVPLALGVMTQFSYVFGWAKPVPITPQNFKSPRRDALIVALAGPFMNLIMCFGWALIMKLTVVTQSHQSSMIFLFFAARAGIFINLILFLFNMLPLPPLDGSQIVSSLLPPKYDYYYRRIEPYGFFIVLFLMFTGILIQILRPMLQWCLSIILTIVGL